MKQDGDKYRRVVIERIANGGHNCTHCGMLCQDKYVSWLSAEPLTDLMLQYRSAATTKTIHNFGTLDNPGQPLPKYDKPMP